MFLDITDIFIVGVLGNEMLDNSSILGRCFMLSYIIFFAQVIILARECGLKLELSDISVKNLVPEPLRVIL